MLDWPAYCFCRKTIYLLPVRYAERPHTGLFHCCFNPGLDFFQKLNGIHHGSFVGAQSALTMQRFGGDNDQS